MDLSMGIIRRRESAVRSLQIEPGGWKFRVPLQLSSDFFLYSHPRRNEITNPRGGEEKLRVQNSGARSTPKAHLPRVLRETSRNQIVFSAEKPTDFRVGHARLIKITCFEFAREKRISLHVLISPVNLEANEFQIFFARRHNSKIVESFVTNWSYKIEKFFTNFCKIFLDI